MTEDASFVAVLLHDTETDRDRALVLPLLQITAPPSHVRIPTTFAGAEAWDVYELIGAEEWPEQAVYRHVALEPSTQSHLD